MAEAQAPGPAEGPDEAMSAIRSRVEQLSQEQRRLAGWDEEEEQAEVVDAEVALVLGSAYKVAQEAMDEWDSTTAAASIDELDAYLERLRKDVTMAEEGNQKVSAEISVTAETTFNDMIQVHVGIEMLESLFSNLGPKLKTGEGEQQNILQTDLCRNQGIGNKDYKFELEKEKEKSTMELEVLQQLQRDDGTFQLESMLLPFGAKVLDFKDNCLRMFLKAPILTSDCEIYGQKFNSPIDSFISDHELLIEIDKTSMAPKKVQIIPDDIPVDILIERMDSSREAVSSPTLEWFIQQCQHQSIVNALRQSLVKDANSSRHSFKYFNKEEMIVAHLDCGIDVSIKMSSDWPLCSYGLKLISICNSGNCLTNIASTLLSKTKELANELELQTRRHLLTFMDAVEEILIRELRPC